MRAPIFSFSTLKSAVLLSVFSAGSVLCLGQMVGGWSNNDLTPRKMEAALPTAGTLNTDVNLFNGELQASEVLGTVSAPAGLSFTLTMSYHNDILLGSTPSVSDGIPYGKGWSLNIPSVSMSLADYRTADSWNTDCLAEPGNCPISSEKIDPRMEGSLNWHDLRVNIPGVASGKAVFKNIVSSQENSDNGSSARRGLCYVLEGFETFIEIYKIGDRFIGVTPDGIYYNFDVVVSSFRNPVSARYEMYNDLDDLYKDNGYTYMGQQRPTPLNSGNNINIHLPKEEYLTFYVSYIYNSNTLEGITFGYERFGGFSYYEEFNQPAGTNDFRDFFGFHISPAITGVGNFKAYREILLTKVFSGTPLTLIDEIDLVYATHNIGGTDMLNFNEQGVQRMDSMYNYKTVFSTVPTGCVNWKRYYHQKVQIPNHPQSLEINPLNPYLNSAGERYFNNVAGNSQSIPFNHAYLESPRLGANTTEMRIPGDLYELKSVLWDNDDVGANIDFNIVTGIGNQTLSPGPIDQQEYNGGRNETIFSTFRKSFKWNSKGGYNSNINGTPTRNLFQMPFIPENYDGYYIQIGPANSDNKFNYGEVQNTEPIGNSYWSYFHHYYRLAAASNPACQGYGGGGSPLYAHDPVPANFGIGLPWSGTLNAYRNLFDLFSRQSSVTGVDFIDDSYGFKRWWNFLDEFGNPVNTVNSGHDNNPTYCDEGVSVGEIELVRYSKNPYMLSQVNIYKYSGNMRINTQLEQPGRKLIAQKLLRYNTDTRAMYRVEVTTPVFGAKYQKDSLGNWIDDHDNDGISDRLQGIDAYGVAAGAQDYNVNGTADWDEDLDGNSIPDGYQHGRPLIFSATMLHDDKELMKLLLSYQAMETTEVNFVPAYDSVRYAIVKYKSFNLERMNNLTKTDFLLYRIVDIPVSEKELIPQTKSWNDLKNYPHVSLKYDELPIQENYAGMEYYTFFRPFGAASNFSLTPSFKVLTGITDKLGGKKEIAYYALNRPETMIFQLQEDMGCPGGGGFVPEFNLSSPRPVYQINTCVKSVGSRNESDSLVTRNYEYDIRTYLAKHQFTRGVSDSLGSNGIAGKWRNRIKGTLERGFGKTTEYFPHLGNPNERSKSVHYFHSTPTWSESRVRMLKIPGNTSVVKDSLIYRWSYDSLSWRSNYFLFGKLKKTENYNPYGRKVTETENVYQVGLAYENGMIRPNFLDDVYYSYDPLAAPIAQQHLDSLIDASLFWSAFAYINFGEIASTKNSYFIKKTKDISREFDNAGVCQSLINSAINPVHLKNYLYEDDEPTDQNKPFDVVVGEEYTDYARLPGATVNFLLNEITKPGASVSSMLVEFQEYRKLNDTILHTLTLFQGESVYPVMKDFKPFTNRIITSILQSNNLTDHEKELLISPQQPLPRSFLLSKIPRSLSQGSSKDKETRLLLKASGKLSRDVMDTLAARADSLPASFITEVSRKQPWLNVSYITALLSRSEDMRSAEIFELIAGSRILNDEVYSAIFSRDSLPDENVLLALATEVAYPSDSVLRHVMHPDTRLSDDFFSELLNNSPYQLEENTVNLIIGTRASLHLRVNWNYTSRQPGIQCNGTRICDLVMEQITEYDYYDARYDGITYSPGYRIFKIPDHPAHNNVKLTHEPSWLLHCSRSYSPQMPDAYTEQRYYYLWDRREGAFGNSDVLPRLKSMGWRSLVYQTMERSKACGQPEKEKSTFYVYDRRWQTPEIPSQEIVDFSGPNICPSSPEPGQGDSDPRPAHWIDFENVIGMFDDNRSMAASERMATRLMLREINVQAAEPITNAEEPGGYMQTPDEWTWQALNSELPVRLAYGLGVDDEGEHDKLTFIYPCPVVRTAHILQRNIYHQPILVEDEKELRYRYFYKDPEYFYYRDTVNKCNSHSVDIIDYPGMPMAISIGSGLADSLYTTYTYDDATLLLSSETDPNGMVSSYEYDKWRRPKNAFINGDKVGTNNYHYWNQDSFNENMTFADRAKGNWMEAVVYNSDNTLVPVEQTRSYADPFGRNFHTWSRTVLQSGLTSTASELLHSGEQQYDAWGRVIKAYKPFVQTGTGLALNPLTNTAAAGTADDNWSESVYENDPRSRLFYSSKPAVTGTETHRVGMQYKLMTGGAIACELKLSLANANDMMAGPFEFYTFRRVKTTDEDGKVVFEYMYPNGKKVAERRHIGGQVYAITLFFYDSRGNLRKTVNPERQVSTYKYNLAGNLYEKRTPDDGTVRYMYNRSGQVVLEQDQNMRNGIPLADYAWNKYDIPTLFPYYRQYCYDIYGRMTVQQKLMIQPDHRDLGSFDSRVALLSWPVDALAYGNLEGNGETLDPTILTNSYTYYFHDRSSLSWLAKAIYNRLMPYGYEGGGAEAGLSDYYIYEGNTNDPPLTEHAVTLPEKRWVYDGNFDQLSDDFIDNDSPTGGSSRVRGRLSLSVAYKDAEERFPLIVDDENASVPVVENVFFAYNNKGQLLRETHQVNNHGISYDYRGYSYVIEYPAYDLRGNALEQIVNIMGGPADMRYSYAYDPRGRLKEVYMALGTNANDKYKVASYTYDDARGTVAEQKHHNRCPGGDELLNTITYQYDHRDRLKSIGSPLYREELLYDNLQNAYGLAQSQNYNGNINAVTHNYLDDAGTVTFNYSDITAFKDSKRTTAYGYTYDGLNRLKQSDAVVPGFHGGYGDTEYDFDRIGNIIDHKRGWRNGPGQDQPERWSYEYTTATNRLRRARGFTHTATRNYTYDPNGNLATDTHRDIINVRYDRANLPTRLRRDYHDNVNRYTYNAADQRIAKLSGSLAIGDLEVFELYLRDAAGRELATINVKDNTTEWYAYGTERVARFRPLSGQFQSVSGNQFASSPAGMLLNDNSAKVNYPVTLVYGKVNGAIPYVYRKDYLMWLDTMPHIVDTLARSLSDPTELIMDNRRKMLDQLDNAATPKLRKLILDIMDGALRPRGPRTPWTPWTPVFPPPPPPPVPPSYPLICQCPGRVHEPLNEEPLTMTYSSFSNTIMGNITFYLYDHLGNTRATYYQRTCGSNMLVVENMLDYDPYGKVLRQYSHNNDKERYVTTQHERDKETGYDYRGARFYDSDIARFLSVDPSSGKYPDMSSFSYVAGNPIRFMDMKGDTIVRYDNSGTYIGLAETDQPGFLGQIMENDNVVRNFSFNHIADDRQRVLTGLSSVQIQTATDVHSIVNQTRNEFEVSWKGRYFFALTESTNRDGENASAKMDYLTKIELADGTSKTRNTFYLTDDNTAYNNQDYGNYLWGGTMNAIGIGLSTSKFAAHVNSFLRANANNRGNGNYTKTKWFEFGKKIDSPEDQRAIEKGYYSQ